MVQIIYDIYVFAVIIAVVVNTIKVIKNITKR